MTKPIIIAIVGASGSGKTHLSKFLHREMHIPMIVSTTTRPRRKGEIEGVDYFFVEDTGAYDRNDMLTYTRFGKYEYFSLKKQVPKTGFCTYVVDEIGVRALKRSTGDDYGVFSVTVQCKAENRIARGVDPVRIERDKNRKGLGYMWVDLAIYNNGTLEEFEQAGRDLITVAQQWQHLL